MNERTIITGPRASGKEWMHGWPRPIVTVIAVCLLVVLAGCSGPSLVQAPNLYVDSKENPYADVPQELQSGSATVLYATDRQSEVTKGVLGYTTKRSRAVAFGLCTVSMGENATWEQLVQASRTRERVGEWPLALTGIDERGQIPALPAMTLVDDRWVENPSYLQDAAKATEEIHRLLAEQLAKTPLKEVTLFVHGYNNTFASGAFRSAQIWHFTGRRGVPVLYSWPAGSTGLLRGYTHDRESGEFTNSHLKQFIRAVASCPELKKVNLVAHSRGTDILTNALRELHIECRAAGKNTRDELKLGQVVLAAPDLDLDVFVERFSAERTGFVPERLTIYISPNDKAIGMASWLFGSARRLGRLALGDLDNELASGAEKHPILNIVDVRARTDRRGHGYFLSSPAALSDLILVLRDRKAPGAANGRPLIDEPGGFWQLRDGYPNIPEKTPEAK
ncbi:MAG: alpha/beta hydrolase [Planctomycetes bacterium]|nr:alpha/beta hydrolase [Planctomycetota bacterium]